MQYRVPRGKIPWFPKIDLDACIGDKECINFCKNDVIVWNELKDRPEVSHQLRCRLRRVFTDLPWKAICFPSRDELRRTVRALVQEAHQTAGQPT